MSNAYIAFSEMSRIHFLTESIKCLAAGEKGCSFFQARTAPVSRRGERGMKESPAKPSN